MSKDKEYAPQSVRRRVSLHPKTVQGAAFRVTVNKEKARAARLRPATSRIQKLRVDPRVWKAALRIVRKHGLNPAHIEVLGTEEVVVHNYPVR